MKSDPVLDARLLELNALYAASLPGKLHEIEEAMQEFMLEPGKRDRLERLHTLLHGLTGSAGTFGFAQLGSLARELEMRCSAWLKGATCKQEDLADMQASLAGLRMHARQIPGAKP